MTIIVPDDLAAFTARLDQAKWDRIVAGLAEPRTEVALSLPKFGTETKVGLATVLAAMGMPLAFDPDRADFSGITSEAELYIKAAIHQANLDVDEKGTEAAAATAVVAGIVSRPPPPVPFKVDRPFVFALRDVTTGAIVFLGQITSPAPRD
jgi:serpin B